MKRSVLCTATKLILLLLLFSAEASNVAVGQEHITQIPTGLIAFASDASGRDEIYTIQTDGSNLRQLTTISGTTPDWSPNGEQIVYSSLQNGSYDLFVMNADGSNQRLLLTLPDTHEYSAAWSPNGQYIAFVARARESHRRFDIYVMSSDGTDLQVLSASIEGRINISPSWSPDSLRIYFLSNQPYEVRRGDLPIQLGVFSIALNGANLHNYQSGANDPNNAELAPDGQGLLLDSIEGGGGGRAYGQDVYFVNLVEGTGYALSRNEGEDIDASWSPNASHIVFSRREADRFVLYLMQADGQNQIRLTNTTGGDELSADWQPIFASPAIIPTATHIPR